MPSASFLILSAIGGSPDLELFRFLDEFFAELRMGNGNDCLGTLPGGQALEAYLAVLGYEIMGVGPCIGNGGARSQGRYDAALQLTAAGGEGGGAADKALSTI